MGDQYLVTERELAETYNGGAYDDAWEAVQQYRKATSYAFRNDVKSGTTARALELPRSRVRTWVDDGGAPDAVRGIETAWEYGWIEILDTDPDFECLNILVANVFSGGSISKKYYQPSFTLDEQDCTVLQALEAAGVGAQVVGDRVGRANEARPAEAGAVLGRVLAVLGAPVGEKARQHISLPSYLNDASNSIRSAFVMSYIRNRAVAYDDKDTLRIQEERDRDYLESLADLIIDVIGEGVTLQDQTIIISANAARTLGYHN